MGAFSKKDRKTYQNICHLSEKGVLQFMKDFLTQYYGESHVIATKSYIIAIGEIPVALVAHADTVFKRPPSIENFFYDSDKDVIWNPDGAGADDRAGIFAIQKIIRLSAWHPHVIITTGEESGCIGAGKLISHLYAFPGDLRFMIQLDRRGHNDSVYYDCINADFEKFINPFGFTTAWGSFTDISVLAPAWKVAAVNLSIGYEDEHHEIERLHVDWMFETIDKVLNILKYVKENLKTVPVYEYIEAIGWHYHDYRMHSIWYDYDDDYQVPEGYDHCFMCNGLEKKEDMLPVWYPRGVAAHNLCMECYSDVVHQVVWCKKCNRGIFLSVDAAKAIPDVNNWVCEDCNDGRIYESTETIRSSNSGKSGVDSDQHNGLVQKLENKQSSIYRQDGFDDLRAGYASDL